MTTAHHQPQRRTPLRAARHLAVGVGCVVVLTGCSTPPSTTPATPAASSPTAPPGRTIESPSDTEPVALNMYPLLTWKPYHGTRLPYSDRWGPQRIESDAATGFTHDPEGALLAMMQQQARLAAADDTNRLTVARVEAVVAPDDSTPTRPVSTGFDSHSRLPNFAGFHWVSYTPARSVADLALQNHDGTLNSVRVQEIWTGSDWKTELPAATTPSVTPLTGFDGYQPWPGLP